MNVFIDDVIRKLIEIKNDGYSYCNILDLPADGDLEASMSFHAIDEGGEFEIDYDDDLEILEVSDDELTFYAFRNKKPSHDRKPIKNITITE